LPENFFNNRSHNPYSVLKVSAQMDELFLKYEIPKKWTIVGAFVRKKWFSQTHYFGREAFT
jgi:hypothetical protein